MNQPMLPHVIVVLNCTDLVDERELDADFLTNRILSGYNGCLQNVPIFEQLAQIWGTPGRPIRVLDDLIKRCFFSFTVSYIPDGRNRNNLLRRQLMRLYDIIVDKSQRSYRKRNEIHMLFNADEFGFYLQTAFDHFSSDLETAFNFEHASLTNQPLPEDFVGNVLRLATTIKAHAKPGSILWMFRPLSQVVASCVLLDYIRYRKGLPRMALSFASS